MRLVFLLLLIAPYLSAQQRYALVIGNADYTYAGLGPTPVNDANAMRDALTTCGFEVDFYTNLDQIKLNTAISTFVRKVKSHRGAALFYYSGHGVQHNNQNYLVPIGSELTDEYDVAGLCIPVNRITAMLTGAGSSPNLLVLDACRAFPLQREDKNLNQGLANENYIGSELLVAYATAPGNTATLRGENGLSLYTSQFIKHLRTPGLRIEDVLKNTRRDVLQKSSGQQRPDETGSLVSDFYFTPAIATDTRPPVVEKELPKTQPDAPETTIRAVGPDADLDGTPDATDACPNDYGPSSSKGCPDYDEDGVPNASDKCPNVPGKKAWQGCPDSDSDGLPDHEDICPTVWGTSATKGCPAADRDKDGTPDDNDVCPDQYGPKLLSGCPDTDGDGVADKSDKCPDKSGLPKYQGCPDTDGDGVPDHEDKCPEEKGSINADGCIEWSSFGFAVNDFIRVEGGAFKMGGDQGDNEKPIHNVTIPAFYIGKFEITNRQFCLFLNDLNNFSISPDSKKITYNSDPILQLGEKNLGIVYNNGTQPDGVFSVTSGYESYPVTMISWYGANEYCKWLSKQTGQKIRLPSESEWEYAAKGGQKSSNYEYSGSNDVNDVAWILENANSMKQIGEKKPNELGIFDMSGNAREWCADDSFSDYTSSPTDGSPWLVTQHNGKVLRGGSWYNTKNYSRVAYRDWFPPTFTEPNYGFRIVREIRR